jgi:hypothetical protein
MIMMMVSKLQKAQFDSVKHRISVEINKIDKAKNNSLKKQLKTYIFLEYLSRNKCVT